MTRDDIRRSPSEKRLKLALMLSYGATLDEVDNFIGDLERAGELNNVVLPVLQLSKDLIGDISGQPHSEDVKARLDYIESLLNRFKSEARPS